MKILILISTMFLLFAFMSKKSTIFGGRMKSYYPYYIREEKKISFE